MRQQTLADGSFEKFRKKNRKELFLDDMEQIIPWQDLCGVIEPYYPKPEGAGRGPVGIECRFNRSMQHFVEKLLPNENVFESKE